MTQNQNERDHYEEPGVDGTIGFIWLRIGIGGGLL
jgi:hypothetical protein